MNILQNLNHRLSIEEETFCCGKDKNIERVIKESSIILPGDYTEFLKSISGSVNGGIEIFVDGGEAEFVIWDAEMALEKREEFDAPFLREFLEQVWLIGDDLGDLIYFYGEGKEGFGLYRTSAGSLCFESANKIANSLTDFLVKGIGIDIAITL